jgi:hypothetical protein
MKIQILVVIGLSVMAGAHRADAQQSVRVEGDLTPEGIVRAGGGQAYQLGKTQRAELAGFVGKRVRLEGRVLPGAKNMGLNVRLRRLVVTTLHLASSGAGAKKALARSARGESIAPITSTQVPILGAIDYLQGRRGLPPRAEVCNAAAKTFLKLIKRSDRQIGIEKKVLRRSITGFLDGLGGGGAGLHWAEFKVFRQDYERFRRGSGGDLAVFNSIHNWLALGGPEKSPRRRSYQLLGQVLKANGTHEDYRNLGGAVEVDEYPNPDLD